MLMVISDKTNLYDNKLLYQKVEYPEAFLEACSNAFPETIPEILPKKFPGSFLETIIP